MKKSTACLALVLALGATGCPTTFYGSAPAQPGTVYTVGGKANDPMIWACPTAGGDCKEIEVVEVEK